AGERPRAFIVLREGQQLSADDVTSFTAEHVATYKVIHDVVFTDSIPKSASGKILRRLLRDG
ncbi:MAG: Long-chain-fatty-acid--CoA ligase, partial [Actinomycetota bacterium]